MNSEHARQVYDFQEVKRLVPLVAVLERYGILSVLKRNGSNLVGACPIDGGRGPRKFAVNTNTNEWKCFGDCGGGSTIEFVAAMENVSIIEAARLIAGWFAISSSTRLPSHRNQQRRKHVSSSSNNAPSFKVFNVNDREYKDPKTGELKKGWWSRIGTAFPTKDGGHSITFDALPTPTIYDGVVQTRVVLRPFDSEDNEPEPPKKSARK